MLMLLVQALTLRTTTALALEENQLAFLFLLLSEENQRQREAPRCLFSAMAATEQTGPRPISVLASLSLLDPIWPTSEPHGSVPGLYEN